MVSEVETLVVGRLVLVGKIELVGIVVPVVVVAVPDKSLELPLSMLDSTLVGRSVAVETTVVSPLVTAEVELTVAEELPLASSPLSHAVAIKYVKNNFPAHLIQVTYK